MKNQTKYACEFSPDGKTWVRNKIVGINFAWNWLIKETIIFKLLNKQAKVRIVNLETNYIIGDNE